MNETKKILTLLGIFAVIIIGVIGLNIYNQKAEIKKYEKYEEIINSEKAELIFIGRPTCTYCAQLMPIIEELSSTYNFNFEYVNTDELSETLTSKILDKLETDSSTPQMFIVKDGKIVSEQQGFVERDVAFQFLQNGGIIDKDAELEEENQYITKIGESNYTSLVNSDSEHLIVIGQTTCTYCIQAKPILNAIAKENDTEIFWVDLDALEENERTTVNESLGKLIGEEFGTPTLIVVKDGKLVNSKEGLASKEDYVSFMKENNIIK